MNIIFITTLYPDNEKQTLTEVPFTLHYFVKDWINQGHHVQVIKIEAIYPPMIPKYSNLNRDRFERDVVIDGVLIHVLQVRKNLNRKFSKKKSISAGQTAVKYLDSHSVKWDIVIFHVFEPNYYIAQAVKNYFKIPMVYGVHQTDAFWISKAKNQKILLKNKDKINAFAFRSQALKKHFKDHLDPAIPSFLIPSGIPEHTININQQSTSNKTLTFITVANMIKRKNIDILIKAFHHLIQIDKDVRLTIIGDGVERDNLEELVVKLNISKNVFFLGKITREKVFLELSHNDVFVLPSIHETFGIVYLEAMARNCIPIGTVNEGIDGIIQDGVNGYLCSPDVIGCFHKMQQVLEIDNSTRHHIHKQIATTVLEYTETKCSAKYIENINLIIHQSKAHSEGA